jgi:hypothetical protein
MPRFQGSLDRIVASREEAAANLDHIRAVRTAALDKARADYESARQST